MISYMGQVVPLRNYLAVIYPNCFSPRGSNVPKRPLKIGILNDILRDFPHMEQPVLREALRCWGLGVLKQGNMVVGAPRIDLIGNQIGVVQQKHVDFYRTLKRSFRRKAERAPRETEIVEPEAREAA